MMIKFEMLQRLPKLDTEAWSAQILLEKQHWQSCLTELPQTFNLLKKKRKEKHNKTNHNKTRYACTMHWMLRRIKRWKIQNLLPQGTQALFGSKNINLWKLQPKNKIKNFFSSSLLRYSWHTALCNFKLYGIMIYICHEMIIKVRSVNIHYLI